MPNSKTDQNHPAYSHKLLDASGLNCPLPLLKMKLELNALEVGQCLKVIATDSGSVRDFHSFVELSGHRMVDFKETDEAFIYVIEKTS